MFVFVYGTLKNGYGNNRLLRESTFVREAIVDGFEAYQVGFPVAMPKEGYALRGEIWDIGDPETDSVARFTLGSLDGLESYDKDNEEYSMYLRRPQVTRCGASVQMYVGNPKDWSGYLKEDRMCHLDEEKVYTWSRDY